MLKIVQWLLLNNSSPVRTGIDAESVRRTIYKAAMVLAMAVASGVVIAVLLAAMFYTAFVALTYNGFDPLQAALIVLCVAAAVAAGCVYATIQCFNKLKIRVASPQILDYSLKAKAKDVADAFLDGLMGKTSATERRYYN